MDDEGKYIAVIVSNSQDQCKNFLKMQHLPIHLFKIASEREDVAFLKGSVPIIVTYHACRNLDSLVNFLELIKYLKQRFASVRYIDY